MKRLIFLGLTAVVLTLLVLSLFAPLRSAEAAGEAARPPLLVVCHVPPGVVVPTPTKQAAFAHFRHGDCRLPPQNKPGDRCICNSQLTS